jgi:glycine/sarcosine N-methyltransferase
MRKPSGQDYGSNPLSKRHTDLYKQEYIHSFVDKWDQLIDWDRRAESEGDFFVRILRDYGTERVLDVATGTGFHSVQLLKAGFDVTSVDGSPNMLVKAFENARKRGHILQTIQGDWRWLNRDVHGTFDAVICLGNSFTHLHSEHDRRRCLAEFYATLDHDGILILDQRNYDAILDYQRTPTHHYYYCGDQVKAAPEHVDETLARFRYEFPDQSVFHLNMFPLRKAYMHRLMKEVGFQKTKTYGDFKETYKEEEPDFFIHVADKRYVPEDEGNEGDDNNGD